MHSGAMTEDKPMKVIVPAVGARARGPLRRGHRPARGRGHRHPGRLDRRQRPHGRRGPPLRRRLLGGRGRLRRAEGRIGESRTWQGFCACMEAALRGGFFVSTRFLCSSRRPHPSRQLGFRIPTKGARCRWGSLALARAIGVVFLFRIGLCISLRALGRHP